MGRTWNVKQLELKDDQEAWERQVREAEEDRETGEDRETRHVELFNMGCRSRNVLKTMREMR